MLIVLKPGATEEQRRSLVATAEGDGFRVHPVPDTERRLIVTGERRVPDPAAFIGRPGVADARQTTRGYELASREVHPRDSVVRIGSVPVGGPSFVVIGGPCAVESREQTLSVARQVQAAGAHILRGGAFKPRTSPYSFQGLGEAGLKILAEAREQTGLPVVTEALDVEQMDMVEDYADAIQIGSRNMHNFPLLKRAGRARKPVMLKRGFAATLEELLMAAEYILAEGNPNVVLCERGIRAFSDFSRNTLDLSVVPAAEALTHLPIVVDPSHAAGRRDLVAPLARAAAAVGADAIMVEVQDDPGGALCDSTQAVAPDAFAALVAEVGRVASSVDRPLLRLEPRTHRWRQGELSDHHDAVIAAQ
jgi:3-deoxy-7-phosphoheptulonate synthase